jgi:membrane protein YqaA with SNARE-associated domain
MNVEKPSSVSRDWAFLLSFKSWLESFAQKPYALWALFSVAFAEASFLPVSVDIPLIALGVSSPKKSLLFGAVATLGSFAGGFAGYYIGLTIFEVIGKSLLNLYGLNEVCNAILAQYANHGITTLMFSGFTPFPYIVFTITAGFNGTLDLWTLTVGALIGRSLRFLPVGILLYFYGGRAKIIIEKYFGIVTAVFILVILLGILYFKWFY